MSHTHLRTGLKRNGPSDAAIRARIFGFDLGQAMDYSGVIFVLFLFGLALWWMVRSAGRQRALRIGFGCATALAAVRRLARKNRLGEFRSSIVVVIRRSRSEAGRDDT